MDHTEQRDPDEERYWKNYCPEHDESHLRKTWVPAHRAYRLDCPQKGED